MLYPSRRANSYYRMRLTAVQDKRAENGVFYAVFSDDEGEVKASWPAHCQGDARRSLCLVDLDNAHMVVGALYEVWFNVNSIPTKMGLIAAPESPCS